jgi:tetratricopeptide (TPR) repeat protein
MERIAHWRFAVERGDNLDATEEQVVDLLSRVSAGELPHWELRLIRAMINRLNGKLEEAADELLQVEAYCHKSTATRLLAQVTLEHARQQFALGNLGKALVDLRHLLRAGFSSLDPVVDGDARFLHGRILAMNGETWEAEAELNRALTIFTAEGDFWRQAEAQSALAMVLVRQGRFFDGIGLWHKSLAFYESEGNQASVARELERIGYATWCSGDIEQTRRTLHRVLQSHESSGAGRITRGLLATHYNLAGLELLDGNLTRAREHVDIALSLGQQLDDRIILSATRLLDATILALEGKQPAAISALEEALQLASAINYNFPVCERPLISLIYMSAGEVYAARTAWPDLPLGVLDGAQRMSLLTVLAVLRELMERADSAAEVEQYLVWEREITGLIGPEAA